MASYGRELSSLLRVMEVIRTEAANHPSTNNTGELSLMQAQVVMAIAIHPGITSEDLSRTVGMSQASTSRNTNALSKWRELGRPGADYVESIEDPRERRRKIHFLTPRGKTTVRKTIEAATGQPAIDFDVPTAREWERGLRGDR